MNGSRHENNLNLCFHGDDAPCSCACPFDFDLRSFMEKMQLGRFDAAFRLYRNAVVFPDIVWRICPAPCGKLCARSGRDAPLSFNLLERACLDYARATDPIVFNLPRKAQRIAIIGAGLSGLTCAMKFAPKKYDVTIYEKSDAIGGGLSRYIPEEIFLAEFQKQLGGENYTLLLNTPAEDISLLDFDAVYVSSGAEAAGEGDHIFRCPPDIGPLEMILDGINSLYEIEWYMKTGRRKEAGPAKPKVDDGARIPGAQALTPAPPVIPTNGYSFTKEEAVAEAKRCIRCDCSACLDNCELLRKYQMYPVRLMDEVNLTMNPVTLFTGRAALREICSCSQCGLCKQVCPVDVDIGDYFLRARRELEETKALPEAFHDFWLRDMAFSNDEARLLLRPPGETQFVFFPGCQLGASDPRYVTLTYEYLLGVRPGVALLLRCCGAPALWAGDEGLHSGELSALRGVWEELGRPVFLLACPSCRKMFRDYLPEIPCRMIYGEFLSSGIPGQGGQMSPGQGERPSSDFPHVPGEGAATASVFDPCASRDDPSLQQSVRDLAESAGFTLLELPHSREEARCCSWGGQSFTADPALAQTVVANAISQSDRPYITYCVNCRDILCAAGKPCWHILDVIFGINDNKRPGPTATARRRNRAGLKRALADRYGDKRSNEGAGDGDMIQDGDAPHGDGDMIRLFIDDGLARRMSDALILEEDVCAVIAHSEETGQKLLDPGTGRFVGHLRRGIVTYWAVYAPQGDGFALFDAYSHRMAIEE